MQAAPQVKGMPPPPQVPLEQVPQLNVPLQPSDGLPQVAPASAQVRGTQVVTQTFAEPQTLGDWQVPQLSVPEQPSGMVPQFFACNAQVVGVQVPTPQTLAVPPPPQVSRPEQLPQLSMPQCFPSIVQVAGTQLPPPPPVVPPPVPPPVEPPPVPPPVVRRHRSPAKCAAASRA